MKKIIRYTSIFILSLIILSIILNKSNILDKILLCNSKSVGKNLRKNTFFNTIFYYDGVRVKTRVTVIDKHGKVLKDKKLDKVIDTITWRFVSQDKQYIYFKDKKYEYTLYPTHDEFLFFANVTESTAKSL